MRPIAAAAIAAFDAIAGDASVDPLFRDAARTARGVPQARSAERGAGGRRRADLARRRRRALPALARLALAALAICAGEYDEAGKELDLVLGDPEVSPTERELAERWLGLVAANRAGK